LFVNLMLVNFLTWPEVISIVYDPTCLVKKMKLFSYTVPPNSSLPLVISIPIVPRPLQFASCDTVCHAAMAS
jgi:hypothetical protein